MPKKLNLIDVKIEFEKRGYELLENEYINATTKMKYRCPKHMDKICSISVHGLKKGQGCSYCSGNHKYSLEEVKSIFNDKGYILLDNKYKNNNTKMRYLCPNHPEKENYICLKDLMNDHGCAYCAGLGKHNINDVKKEFNDRDYVLLETEYKNALYKMKYKCNKHPNEILYINYNKFNMGQGCKKCGDERKGLFRKGEDSPAWKGGVTDLNDFLRSSKCIRDWRKESLKENDKICYITKEKLEKFDIHHIIPFHKIRDNILSSLKLDIKSRVSDYSAEELQMIIEKFSKYHKENKGIVMKKELHILFHRIYGHNVSEKDIEDFKSKYNKGYFESKIN